MANMTRWLAPAVLAIAVGGGTLAVPATAQAQDAFTRVLVDIADVVLRGDQPYYRHGSYGYDDRLIVQRDRYGNPVYYRRVPANYRYGSPPYGVAHGYRDYDRRTKCNKHGKCKVEYYDPRYDRRGRYDDYDRHDRYARHDRWDRDDRRRWRRDRDDD
jgi:hypothetical protein